MAPESHEHVTRSVLFWWSFKRRGRLDGAESGTCYFSSGFNAFSFLTKRAFVCGFESFEQFLIIAIHGRLEHIMFFDKKSGVSRFGRL